MMPEKSWTPEEPWSVELDITIPESIGLNESLFVTPFQKSIIQRMKSVRANINKSIMDACIDYANSGVLPQDCKHPEQVRYELVRPPNNGAIGFCCYCGKDYSKSASDLYFERVMARPIVPEEKRR